MTTKQPLKMKHKLFITAIAVIGICAAAVLTFLFLFPKAKRTDYLRLSSESYDAAFLSMYPIDNYKEEDFTYWRGMNIVKANYTLPSFSSLKSYMNIIAHSGNTITDIYLGILPEKVNSAELSSVLSGYPGVRFEIILPSPSMDYWLQLSEAECADKLASYEEFVLSFPHHDNISLYFQGASEWLIANPDNYCDDFLTAEEASLFIMLNSDRDHSFLLTNENAKSTFDQLAALIDTYRTNPIHYPDATDYTIFFLGDSVIGNFTGSTSIPGVVAGLTNAQVFNLGYGGGSATEAADDNNSLPDIVNALVEKDASKLHFEEDTSEPYPLIEAMNTCLATPYQSELCFVINYGLNDYFCGFPINSEDSYDISTYAGAIRTAVTTLQKSYPDARIILMTPNFTAYYGNGTQTCLEGVHVLKDYVDCIIALSEELQVELLDNYHELGINAKNHAAYLSDGCHPNETGRFLIGQRIALKLSELP